MAPTRPADYPHLGFDPTPGDVEEVTSLAQTLRGVAEAMAEISSVLHGAGDGEWRGQAAVAFRDMLDDDLRPRVDGAYEAFTGAKQRVQSWSWSLGSFQSRAAQLEQDAAAAQQRIDTANGTLSGLGPAPSPGDEPPEDPAERRQQEREDRQRRDANRARTAATADLGEARRKARELHEDYERRATEIADLLRSAVDAAPDEPGMWDSMWESIGNFFSEIGEALADFQDWAAQMLQEIAPILDFIADLTGLLSTVLGLLAFIPGLQFLAPIALALAAVSLVATYLSAVGETGSFLEALTQPDVLISAASVAIGFGALKVGNAVTTAARVSGNTHQVMQLTRATLEVPYGFFSIARGTVTSMETAEAAWRTVGLHLTWSDWILQTATHQQTGEAIGNVFHPGAGGWTRKPTVVR